MDSRAIVDLRVEAVGFPEKMGCNLLGYTVSQFM
jgi:hypothetical protein